MKFLGVSVFVIMDCSRNFPIQVAVSVHVLPYIVGSFQIFGNLLLTAWNCWNYWTCYYLLMLSTVAVVVVFLLRLFRYGLGLRGRLNIIGLGFNDVTDGRFVATAGAGREGGAC